MCLLACVLQVADLIAMTLQVHKGLPRSERNQVTVDQYTMPTACRKRLKSLQRAPPICYSLPIDPTRTYKVTWLQWRHLGARWPRAHVVCCLQSSGLLVPTCTSNLLILWLAPTLDCRPLPKTAVI
jgi:hypothetical protein